MGDSPNVTPEDDRTARLHQRNERQIVEVRIREANYILRALIDQGHFNPDSDVEEGDLGADPMAAPNINPPPPPPTPPNEEDDHINIRDEMRSGFRQMLSNILVDWPSFDGKGSMTKFIERFNETAVIAEYDEERRATFLPSRLKVKAKASYEEYDQDTKDNYTLAAAALVADFCNLQHRQNSKAQLRNLTQGSLDVRVFAKKVKSLTNDAFHGEDEAVKKSHRQDIFLTGLDPQIRRTIRQQNCEWTTYSELVNIADQIAVNLNDIKEEDKLFAQRSQTANSGEYKVLSKWTNTF